MRAEKFQMLFIIAFFLDYKTTRKFLSAPNRSFNKSKKLPLKNSKLRKTAGAAMGTKSVFILIYLQPQNQALSFIATIVNMAICWEY